MAQIGSDSFTGNPGDALPTYNPAWVSVPGVTGVMVISAAGDRTNATASGVTAAYFRSDITPPGPDYSVSADFIFVAQVVNGPAMGVIARASEAANTSYELRYLSTGNGNGSWQLRRLLNGTGSTLSSVAGTHAAGDIKNVKISVISAEIKGIVDGVEILSSTDSAISAAGRPGLRSFGATSVRIQTDNFSVDTPGPATQPGNATVTGVAANPAAGQVAASGAATASIAGVRANPAVGTVAASGQATATVQGAAAEPGAGQVSASGAASATVQGAAANPQAGTVTASGAASVTVSGVAANPAAGNVTASSGGGAVVTGVAANPAAGQVIASGASRAIVIGAGADPGVGAVTASGAATAIVIGVAANSAAGIVTVELIDGPGEGIDAALVPTSRIVVFEGGKRIVAFEGGKRVVTFEGGNRIVRFE